MKKIITLTSLLLIALLTLVGCSNSGFDSNSDIKLYTRDTTSGTRDGFFTGIGLSEAKEDNAPLKVEGLGTVESNGDMINAIKNDIENRFGGLDNMNVKIMFAYTQNKDAVDEFVEEVKVAIPNCEVEIVNPLSLSVACHIGPGAIAVAVTQNLQV